MIKPMTTTVYINELCFTFLLHQLYRQSLIEMAFDMMLFQQQILVSANIFNKLVGPSELVELLIRIYLFGHLDSYTFTKVPFARFFLFFILIFRSLKGSSHHGKLERSINYQKLTI